MNKKTKLILLATLIILAGLTLAVFNDSIRAKMFFFYPLLTAEPSTQGLVGYWPLDGNALDKSGNGNNGTIAGGATAVAGKVNTSLSFNGTSDFVAMNDSANWDFTGDVTISLWLNPTVITGNHVIFAQSANDLMDSSDHYAYLDNASNTIHWRAKSTGEWTTNVGLTASAWTHVVFVKSGTNLFIYKNGAQSDTTTGASIVNGIAGEFRLGDNYNIDFWNGKMDDVRIYNRALSADEIKQYYDATSGGHYTAGSPAKSNYIVPPAGPGIDSTLVGYWPFDNGAATDMSGTGNNGTLTNGPTAVTGKANGALQFNGGNNYVDLGTGQLTTGATTFAYWYKYNGSGNTYTSDLKIIQSDGVFSTSAGSIRGLAPRGAGITLSSTSSLTDNVWHHVAFVYNGSGVGTSANYKIYDDGIEAAMTSGGGNGTGLTRNVLGSVNGGGSLGFNGSMDDVRIYNRALSAEEVQTIYRGRVTTINSGAATNNVLTSGLVGHWTFDGPDTPWTSATAGTAVDRSGNGNAITFNNMDRSSAPAEGVFGQALQFDGVDDDIRLPDNAFNALGDGSISVWVKPIAFTTSTIFTGSITTGTSNNILIAWDNTNRFYAQARSEDVNQWGFYANSTTLVAGQWYHAVFTKSGTSLSFYINGVPETLSYFLDTNRDKYFDDIASAGTIAYTIGNFRRNTNANYANGVMDDVRVYNRALSASEVQQLYNLGR